MIRLQDRDWDILNDIGKCGLMSYRQIRKIHFDSYYSCYQRISKLIRDGYINAGYYNTDEKLLSLSKYGNSTLIEWEGIEYRMAEHNQIKHKLMRSECYCSVKIYGIKEWKNEVEINQDGSKYIFDASFEKDKKLYLVEVHNEQKSKVLREKLNKCLELKFKFNLIVYCRNKDIVREILDKMNKKGFGLARKYGLTVYEFGEEIFI